MVEWRGGGNTYELSRTTPRYVWKRQPGERREQSTPSHDESAQQQPPYHRVRIVIETNKNLSNLLLYFIVDKEKLTKYINH